MYVEFPQSQKYPPNGCTGGRNNWGGGLENEKNLNF